MSWAYAAWFTFLCYYCMKRAGDDENFAVTLLWAVPTLIFALMAVLFIIAVLLGA